MTRPQPDLLAARKALVEDCARVAGALDRTLPRNASTVTEKEATILRLIGLGLTDKEVARAIGMSRGTAHVHIGRIHVKVAIAGRARLAVTAHLVMEVGAT